MLSSSVVLQHTSVRVRVNVANVALRMQEADLRAVSLGVFFSSYDK